MIMDKLLLEYLVEEAYSHGDYDLTRDILAFGRDRLAGYKVPRSIDYVDELPRHPSGKIYTRRLRDPYWAGRERNI